MMMTTTTTARSMDLRERYIYKYIKRKQTRQTISVVVDLKKTRLHRSYL
jgi:hypothetical protein